jgi:hypothetical protein
MHRQFKLTLSTGLLYRQSTHDVISLIEEDVKKEGRTIALDGKKGFGKSATMFQIISHFKKKDWIVFYVPQLSELVSGLYPYESTSRGIYVQQELACKLLKSMLTMNESQLKSLKGPTGDSVLKIINEGISNLKKSQSAFEKIMEILSDKSIKRPPVLFALDQVNALFCKTQYADKDSIPLTSDRFAIVRSFYSLFQNVPVNSACLIAGDDSLTQIRSYYFQKLLKDAPKLNKDPLDLQVETFQSLSDVSEFGVELPLIMDRSQVDLFSYPVQIPNMTGYVIPALSLEETRPLLQFYKRTNIVNISMLFFI